MAEYGRFCAAGTDSSKWETDSHKLFLSMRDMLCHIHRAVKGDPEVMRQVRVFGIVGSGKYFSLVYVAIPSLTPRRNHLPIFLHDPFAQSVRREPGERCLYSRAWARV